MTFQKRSKFKTYLYSPITSVVLFIVAVTLSFSVIERYQVARDVSDRTSEVQNELKSLEERKLQLEDRVLYLENDSGREAEIRKHFDVAREGEQVVIIVDDVQLKSSVSSTSESSVVDNEPWYKFW